MSTTEAVYHEISAELRHGDNALTVEQAKELIGWTVEDPSDDNPPFGSVFHLKDKYNRKVRLLRNPTNRPLKTAIADRYASEFLRNMWHFNGESVVFGASGEVRDGQHRLVGFILADQVRHINQAKWGKEALTMDVLLAFGFSDDQETADSYDKGQSRSLTDVIYRHEDFGEMSETAQRKMSKTLAEAIRLCWIRTGGMTVSSAPHFPHSEAMEFYSKHKGILSSVKYIIDQDDGNDGNEKLIRPLVSMSYASALHYLMSDINETKADEFWLSVAQGAGLTPGHPVLVLRNFLTKNDAGSSKQRDRIVIAIIKAWLAFVADEKLTNKQIEPKLKRKVNASGDETYVIGEKPRIGGLDEEKESPETLAVRDQLILSAVADHSEEEMSMTDLSSAVGVGKSTVNRLCHTGDNNLVDRKLIKVNEYETEDSKSEHWVKITAKGKKEVR